MRDNHHNESYLEAWREGLTGALISLGFSPKEADISISALVSRLAAQDLDPTTIALSDLLKDALANGKSSRG